ncbi:hypothetical protein V5799_001108 [Amblyomma americanum]|uniref:Transmembrane protein n=1 Tax=Amblyomma americanum TaxID=6943 RepID=A0AAQ4D151_AMBAM
MDFTASTLTLLFLLASLSHLSFTAASQPLTVRTLPEAMTRPSDPEDNVNYQKLEHHRQQQAQEVHALEGGNASGRVVPLLGNQLGKSSGVVFHGDSHSADAVAGSFAGPTAERRASSFFLDYIRAHQVLIYIVSSVVLAGFILVFTLVTVYGDQRRSSWAEDESWKEFGESYPLLDRRPLLEDGDSTALQEHRSAGDDESEPAAASLVDDEVDTTTPRKALDIRRPHSIRGTPSEVSDGPWSTSWSLPDEPVQVVVKSKEVVKRRRGVTNKMTLTQKGAPSTDVADGIILIQSFDLFSLVFSKLNSLRHGTRYRTPNFIEVERAHAGLCRIACVFDQFPMWLLRSDRGIGSRESLYESLASEMAGSPDASDLLAAFRRWKATNQCCLTRHFIVFEQRYAGKPLSRITLRSAVQGRSLFVQASYCVAVAERALGFRHTGVDCDKLLVAVTDEASLEYRLPDSAPLCVDCAGLKALLAGAMSFAFDTEGKEDDDFACRENATDSPSSDYRYLYTSTQVSTDKVTPWCNNQETGYFNAADMEVGRRCPQRSSQQRRRRPQRPSVATNSPAEPHRFRRPCHESSSSRLARSLRARDSGTSARSLRTTQSSTAPSHLTLP